MTEEGHDTGDLSGVNNLFFQLNIAENQVVLTANNTIEDIESSYDNLLTELKNAIQQRKQSLITEVLRIKDDSISSLRPCYTALTAGSQCIRIPKCEEVAHISAHLPGKGLTTRLCNEIANSGRVSRRGPVQILGVEEKPGGLLLRWDEIEPEKSSDMNQYRLQQAVSTPGVLQYHDIYRGPEQIYLARDLIPKQTYAFRVCMRAEGEQEWSAWSLTKNESTSQKPFCWDESYTTDYNITNEGKIATKNNPEPGLLFSHGPQFFSGHSVLFTILEAKESLSDEGLGLAVKKVSGDTLLQPGVLFLSTQGRIFVDGAAKTTRFPALRKGSTVSFTCERISEDKIRVNIDNDNKTVTYDWRVPISVKSLYFIIGFGQIGWKILVE